MNKNTNFPMNKLPEVTLRKIWNEYNHSSIFVLPMFSGITRNLVTRTIPHVDYPLIQICLDYGLVNTYLHNPSYDGDKPGRMFLYLLFKQEEVIKDLGLTTSPYYSFCDLLIDSDHFESTKVLGNKVYICLEIPTIYHDDVKLISKGRYSKVSRHYRDTVRLTQETVPAKSKPEGVYVSSNNIPYSIAEKKEFLKREMEKVLGFMLPDDAEFYNEFNMERELLDEQLITQENLVQW